MYGSYSFEYRHYVTLCDKWHVHSCVAMKIKYKITKREYFDFPFFEGSPDFFFKHVALYISWNKN